MNTPVHDIDIAGLLTIDVDSELRKLSSAQFQGPWQLPAELVRRALRHGAHRVHVAVKRHRVEVIDDGRGLTMQQLEWTATLLDSAQPNARRHAALTDLEREGEVTLLGLFSLHCKSILIESVGPEGEVRLNMERGSRPRLERSATPRPPRTRVVLVATTLDRRQVCQWLQNVGRFAPVPIFLDGKAIHRGFDDAIAHAPLHAPLDGRAAIPKESESAHVWLLEYGLVTAHITVPDAPAFEAAVELGSDAVDLSAARLREAIMPHIKELIDQSIALLIELARTFSTRSFSEPVRAQVARLVLQAALKRLRFEQALELPLLRAVDSHGPKLLSLVQLRAQAVRDTAGVFIVAALYPNQRPDRFALGGSPVLIADATERSRIAELMQVRFRPPEARDSRGSVRASLRRTVDRARDRGRALVGWIRHPRRAKPLPETQLDPAERNFLALMRHELLGHAAYSGGRMLADIQLCHGTGPVRMTSGAMTVLLLPRQNLEVQAAMAAVTADPSWVYPASLVLLDGRQLPPPSARTRWLSRSAS